MTATAADSGADMTDIQRYLILGTVTLATLLFAMTTTNSYVVLPQMQGSLSATQDQIAWTVTFNLMATAVMTPMSGWLSNRFGRRAVMLFCVAGFSAASVLSGTATTLESLIAFRVAQGVLGAPIVPVSQAIILSTFPRSRHGFATAIWGLGVVCGPVLGPTLGGFVAEEYTWRWVFFMTTPVCVLSVFLVWVFIHDAHRNLGTRLDWTGFLALSIAIAAFQLVMDRGDRLDWLESPEIIIESCIAAFGLYVFVIHTLTTSHPFLPPRLLLDRNFSLGLCFVLIFGAISFVPMILIPPLLQDLREVPDSIVGIVLASRGIGSIVGNIVVAVIGSRIDPRLGLTIGFSTQALSGLCMAQFDLNVTIWNAMWASAFQGFGMSFLWVPLTVLTFATLNPRQMGEATAVFHLIRNLGSAIFISICVGAFVHYSGVNYAVMSEHISPFNEVFQFPGVVGAWSIEGLGNLSRLGDEVGRQAAMVGYINAFYLFSAVAAAVIPFIYLLKRPVQGD